MKTSRRNFIRTAGLSTAAILAIPDAYSYKRIPGANEKIRVGIIGANSRGSALASSFAKQAGCEVIYICDVDERAIAKGIAIVKEAGKPEPKGIRDFRSILNDSSLDALAIATPDHWHAPASILCCQAGKHVYVEKPCSHNPAEGELMVAVANKYNRIVQMGTQRRSWPLLKQGMEELRNGVIGRVYFAKGWYTNSRKSIGYGKEALVPGWLDYDLWQGPAPRKTYRDNLIHYNWHWFWHWGTGEALNNGTHEIDLMRWGLGVDYPIRVNSAGGRFHFKDDWQTPDTQIISFDFPGDCSASWESRSCNPFPVEGRDRGVIFYGEKGSISTGGNSYTIYDLQSNKIKEIKDVKPLDGRDAAGPGEDLDGLHIANFLDAIRGKVHASAPIETGFKSTLLCQLGNIAYRRQKTLDVNPENGHIIDDALASKLWSRDYEQGWEPKL